MAQSKIEQIESYVRGLMETVVDPSLKIAHDFKHVDRVRRLALVIANDQKLDLHVVEAAALLHDIGLTCIKGEERAQHAQASAKLAAQFLDEHKLFTDHEIEAIVDAIRSHSSPDGGGVLGQVLRDADKLDALGAVGIMRAFTSKHAQEEYDPANVKGDTWQMPMTDFEMRFSENKGIGEYIVDQLNFQISFYDELRTETAKRIGKPLVGVMKAFVLQLDSEINAAP